MGENGGSLDLPVEPDKQLVRRIYARGVYVIFDISSSSSFCRWSDYSTKLAIGRGKPLPFHLQSHLALKGQTPAE